MANAEKRQHLGELMDLLESHKRQIHYPRHDVRGPLDLATFKLSESQMKVQLAKGGQLMMDCSESVTLLCKWAGLHDPNGLHYSHAGYTGTMLAHLGHYSDPTIAKVGALVVFGPGTGDHVCMVRHPGENPMLFSHGQDAGPIFIPLYSERRFHRPPVTFLNISKL